MALKRYRADRAFDAFNQGDVVELDDSKEWDARQVATGYLEELDGEEGDAAAHSEPPADARTPELQATSTNSAAPAAADEGAPDGDAESASGAPAVARPRRRG